MILVSAHRMHRIHFQKAPLASWVDLHLPEGQMCQFTEGQSLRSKLANTYPTFWHETQNFRHGALLQVSREISCRHLRLGNFTEQRHVEWATWGKTTVSAGQKSLTFDRIWRWRSNASIVCRGQVVCNQSYGWEIETWKHISNVLTWDSELPTHGALL